MSSPDRSARPPPTRPVGEWAPLDRSVGEWTTGVPALSRGTVGRASHRRVERGWLAEAWRHGAVLVLTPDGQARVRDDGGRPRLMFEPPERIGEHVERFFLGELAGRAYFGVVAELPSDPATDSPSAVQWTGLREVGALLDDRDAGLLVTTVALANWHQTHRHCPRCGQPTEVAHAGWARACVADRSEHYPRVDPAMIVLVHDGGERCLLGRQPSWPAGRYSCLAGFVEPGESVEQAAVREVAEEAGVRIATLRYLSSQPWPFPSSLMLGFTALAADDQTPRPADEELEDVRWFSRTDLRGPDAPLLPPPVSIAHRLITGWLDGTR